MTFLLAISWLLYYFSLINISHDYNKKMMIVRTIYIYYEPKKSSEERRERDWIDYPNRVLPKNVFGDNAATRLIDE